MQKTFFLTLITTLFPCHAYHHFAPKHHYAYPPEVHLEELYSSTPNHYHIKRKPAHSSSFILATLYGTLSGCLCRLFERNILLDIPPFRLANILVWGQLQENLLQTIIEDLKEQNVGLSEDTMKKSAWLLSWISYVLT